MVGLSRAGSLIEAIPAALDGERVDRLVAMLADVSRSEAVRLLAAGAVRLDGEIVLAGKQRVREGQVLQLDEHDRPDRALVEPDPDVELRVLHVDDEVIVVDKPAGLVVHPGAGHDRGTLVNGLLARFPEVAEVGDPARPGIVHRLDRGTSGLLVVARTAPAYDSLVAQLSAREVERRYAALVWGVPASSSGVIDAPVGRSPRDPTRMAVATGGREARTRFELQQAFAVPPCALLACRLETGRTHQIRVHLAAIGHPVVGDVTYGGARPALELDRPFLHAGHLAFTQPVTHDRLAFDAALPPELEVVLEGLEVVA